MVTGGEAVVEAARKHTNKRLIAAGAGNPPVVVDETADLARAAQSIVKGASFDNNIICADEKVLIVVDSVADELMRLMEGQHAVKLEGGCHHTAAMHSRNIENMNQMANAIDTSIFVKNGPCIAGLGLGGEGWTTMTITTPTGEGVTSARTFVRLRRCVLVDAFRIV